jgi:pantoate--beta-alanine ligase
MNRVETIEAMRAARAQMRGTVGLVPTMGALHDGHLSLVRAAREDNDCVIVTIFINPAQFGPGEDLTNYPRNLERDLALLEAAGVDLVFTPTPDVMYPPGYQTYVNLEVVSLGLEGEHRPGHFRGVATVVAKLFNLAQPTRAYFGQKDAQQVVVLRSMVRDLNFPLDIIVIPTRREQDGLAMSSRNGYLNMAQREAAGVLYRALRAASDAYDAGERAPSVLRAVARRVLEAEPLAHVEYVAINDPRTLFGIHEPTDDPLLLSMVVQIGRPRLLDNCLLPWSLNDRAGLTSLLGG